jgi:hypothetical protein
LVHHLEDHYVGSLTKPDWRGCVFVEQEGPGFLVAIHFLPIEVNQGLIVAADAQDKVGAVGIRVDVADRICQPVLGGRTVERREVDKRFWAIMFLPR